MKLQISSSGPYSLTMTEECWLVLNVVKSAMPQQLLKSVSSSFSIADVVTPYVLDSLGIESWRGARFSAPVQTGPGAHPASCTMDTGSLFWG
jgi:hypothetical protein